jgi:hypothetical protein
MRSLLLTCLLLSVPASAKVDGFPEPTGPENCLPPAREARPALAMRIYPSDDGLPPLTYFLSTGFEIKTSIVYANLTYLILQKDRETVWCQVDVPGFTNKECHWIFQPRN